MKTITLGSLCAAALVATLSTPVSAEVTIIGALTNFDCPNNTQEPCDEFEIEFEGPHAEDVNHTYCNWNYGCPTVTSTATGVIIDYKRTGHSTNIGVIEHYGVGFTNWNLVTNRQFRWKHNGVVVNSGYGAPPAPIPPPPVVVNNEIVEPVENPETEDSIWIRRSVIGLVGEVNLEQLMFDDPIIQAATPLEVEFERLGPGEVLEAVESLSVEDYIQTQIIVIETLADVATWNPGTQEFDHAAGVLLSRSMNAVIIQNQPCDQLPVILADPVDVTAEFDGAAEFFVDADAPGEGGEVLYQWRHEGLDLIGEDQPRLRVDPLRPSDAGAYVCTVSDDCGSVTTHAAYLTVVSPPVCYGDADEDGQVDFSDVTEVLSHFGMNYGPTTGAGDANHDGFVNFADITNVLANFNSSCP